MITQDQSAHQRCESQLSALGILVDTLSTILDAKQLPVAVLAALGRGLPTGAVALLFLADPATGRYRPAAVQGCDWTAVQDLELESDDAAFGGLLSHSTQLIARFGDTTEPVTLLSPAMRAIFAAAFGKLARPDRILVMPLLIGDRTLGVLWLRLAGENSASAEVEVPFLRQLGSLIALALDRAQLAAAEAGQLKRPSDEVRSEVMATLSHELRTPLAAIKGNATALLLEEVEWPPEEQRELLTLIDRECDTLQAMISEVLDSALIDAGHLGIEPEPVRLPNLIREIADEVQRQTTMHQLVIDFPPGFPIVMADPRRLRQILRNILDNAVKYSPTGGLIVIRGEVRSTDIVVSTADQGIGIAPEDLIPLFDKYFRVKRQADRYIPGTGLGLPITRALVEAHGGHIWAESKVGQGTILYFSLPRADLIPSGAE